jgi:large subunit ribosomal protein L3
LNKPDQGQFKGELPACAVVREFRVDSVDGMTLGQTLDVSLFAEGELVDVVGVSKGKGFAGTIKRHSFQRGPETHGADHHREPGSIGAGTTPGRVYKGTRMAGHMGVDRVTVQKASVVRADGALNVLLIKGSVPGAINSLISVSKSVEI